MTSRWIGCILVFFAVAGTVTAEQIEVPNGYTGKPFSYEMNLKESHPTYELFRITYDAPEPEPGVNPQGVAYYYRPAGLNGKDAPRPGLICLHILGGDGSLTRMIASYMAEQGIPALLVVMPWFGERTPAGGRRAMNGAVLAGAFRQTPGDVRRAIDILQSRPEVNPKKIELVGTSMGALFGATVTGMDARVTRAALLLGGGGLSEILASPNKEASPIREAFANAPADEKPRIDEILAEIEPLKWAPELRSRAESGNILLINAEQDEVIAPAATRKLAQAMDLPADQQVWLPQVGHYSAIASLPELLERLAKYFADASVKPPKTAVPAENLARVLLSQIADLLQLTPGVKVALTVNGMLKNGEKVRGSLLFRRGADDRFVAEVNLEEAPVPLHRLALGNDGALWLGGKGDRIFRGSLTDEGTAPAFPQLDPRISQYRVLASGMFRMAAANPDTLRQIVNIEQKKDDQGVEYLDISSAKERVGLKLYADSSRKRPGRLEIQTRDFQGVITFDEWNLRAERDGDAFSPPAGSEVVAVEAYDLARMLNSAAAFFGKR